MNPTFSWQLAVIGGLLIGLIGLPACGSAAVEPSPEPPPGPEATLTISGAGGTTRVLQLVADAYLAEHDDLAFDFLSGSGSSGGVKGVVGGQLDLGAMSRPPKESELADGIEYLSFARDKVVIATSPDISVKPLTSQQVADIFSGKIDRWSDLGGPDYPIAVLVREESDSNTRILREGIFGDGGFSPGSVTMESEGATRDAIASGTNTIGYLAYSGVRIEDLNVHTVTVDGHDPSSAEVYPFTRQLGAAYMQSRAGKVQPFATFLNSPSVRAMLAENGINGPG